MAKHGNRIWPSRLIPAILLIATLLCLWWFAQRDDSTTASAPIAISASVPIEASRGTTAASTLPIQNTLSVESAADQVDASPIEHPLDPVLALARRSLAHLRKDIQDYECTLIKRERIDGRLSDESRIQLKVMHRQVGSDRLALSVYMKFLEPKRQRGREILWCEGQNQNRLIAHEAGILNLVRVQLDPHGPLAMMGNKYAIDEIGMERLLLKLIEKGERDRLLGPCEVAVEENHQVGSRPCKLIQVRHAEPKPEFDFHVAQIFIDAESGLPIRYAAFDWPPDQGLEASEGPVLLEEYTYLDLQTNVGLSERDFDSDNPQYQFPK